jgi:methylglutaconyl-CoA hydratase
MQKIILDVTDSVATITLNQPQLHNAFDPVMLEELLTAFKTIQQTSNIRILVLQGNGSSFSAGADARWMQQMKQYSLEENKKDANTLAEVMHTLYTLNKPTLAIVHGPALGGGVGLVASCDIAIASENAYFCLSETKLGLIPAVISPYVINAIGERQARRYYLTAEKIDAPTAHRIGLIHEYVAPSDLNNLKQSLIETILKNGPNALAQAKLLIQGTSRGLLDANMIKSTVLQIADIRISEEAQEGLLAFLEKRSPSWRKD